jgi:S-adenosylmethionine uptake transporter
VSGAAAAIATAGRGGIAWMFAATLCFAVMGTAVSAAHAADPGLSTFVTSGFRSAVNLAVLVAVAGRQPRSLLGDGRPALWVRGALGGLSLLTFFTALAHLSVGEAAFLNQTSAVWVAALGPLVLGERTAPLTWLAVAGALLGVFLLAPAPAAGFGLGHAAGLASGLFAAGAYLSIKRAARTNSAVAIVFSFTLVSTVLSVGLALGTGAAWPARPAVLGLLVLSGLAATAGQLLMTAAYRRGRAAPIAAAAATGPLLSALLGAALLGQTPGPRAAAGMAVLLVSSVLLPFFASRDGDQPAAGAPGESRPASPAASDTPTTSRR